MQRHLPQGKNERRHCWRKAAGAADGSANRQQPAKQACKQSTASASRLLACRRLPN